MPTPPNFIPDTSPLEAEQRARTIGELDEFKGHWRRIRELNEERLTRLRQVTTIESTGASTRIEGAELTDQQVGQILRGLSHDSFRARDESEVLGYGELHTLIFESHPDLNLTANHIRQLHGVLLKHAGKDERHRGQYKTLPNDVEARHPDGHREVIFRTATPFDTSRLMQQLIDDTNAALSADEVHPVTIIACFIVNFLAIHPFQDGNGRLSRALTNLLMLRAGYEYVPYASLERVIEENKGAYYAALHASQVAMKDDPSKFGAWLSFFLHALRTQKRNLESKLDLEGSMLRLSALQQKILEAVRNQGRVKSIEIASLLDLPYRNVRYHLDSLVKSGLVLAHGERKGRYYTPSGAATGQATSVAGHGTNGIVAEVYSRGGRISRADLIELVKRSGYDGRVVGLLHGRRVAHLKRDPRSGESVLTPRGEEIAKEFIFSSRLAQGARE
ncbi:MAG: Fic family protein [Gemmatimonadaceae bacterium]